MASGAFCCQTQAARRWIWGEEPAGFQLWGAATEATGALGELPTAPASLSLPRALSLSLPRPPCAGAAWRSSNVLPPTTSLTESWTCRWINFYARRTCSMQKSEFSLRGEDFLAKSQEVTFLLLQWSILGRGLQWEGASDRERTTSLLAIHWEYNPLLQTPGTETCFKYRKTDCLS